MPSRGTVVVIAAVALFCIAVAVALPHVLVAINASIINNIMVLRPSSGIYDAWKDPPIPIYQHFYFFDVQNKEDILRGARPVVRQIGPYIYRVRMPKENVTRNENFTVSYVQPQMFTYERNISVGSEDDTFTTVNIPFVTLVHVMKSKPGFVQIFMDQIIKSTKEKFFVELSVKELLWGYPEPLFKRLQPMVGKETIPSDHFGFLFGKNNSNVGVFTVFTGEDDRSKLNEVNRWAGKSKLDYWGTDIANMINGTDGSMYHPYINKSEILYIFTPDMCRSMPYEYKEDVVYKGVTLLHFPLAKYAYANGTDYPPNQGFCEPKYLPSGLLSVGPCRGGAPMSVSNPHFYGGDPRLAEAIQGLDPDKELHENYLDVEAKLGMPWRFAERLQINIHVERAENIQETGNVRSNHFPVLWFEETVKITDDIVATYKNGFVLIKQISFHMEYILLVIGVVLVIVVVAILFRRSTDPQDHKPTLENQLINSKNGDSEKRPLLA